MLREQTFICANASAALGADLSGVLSVSFSMELSIRDLGLELVFSR